jgi:hypothetical protein
MIKMHSKDSKKKVSKELLKNTSRFSKMSLLQPWHLAISLSLAFYGCKYMAVGYGISCTGTTASRPNFFTSLCHRC